MSDLVDRKRVFKFVERLELAVRGRLPSDHWQIVLDAQSVKLVALDAPASAVRMGHTLAVGDHVGYYFLRETITSTPDEAWQHFIEKGVASVEELHRARLG